MLKEIDHIYQRKTSDQELKIITIFELSQKHLFNFGHQNHVRLSKGLNNSSAEKNINIQQTLYFSFLKNQV